MRIRRLLATSLLAAATARVGAESPSTADACSSKIFRVAGTSPATGIIHDLAVGDFDGDGIPDIAIANGSGGNGVYALLGRADGTFSGPQTMADGINTARVIPGRFDADDDLDVIGGPQLEFFSGNGDGTFQPGVWLQETAGSASAADVNADGELDIVGIDASSIVVLLGNGDGTFQDPIATDTSSFLTVVAVADVIGDSFPDVVTGDGTSGSSVQIYPGLGNGLFGDPIGLPSTESTHYILLADLDANGFTDVVVDDDALPEAGIAVFLNQGQGVFGEPIVYPAYVWGILAADLDRDGHLDLVIPGFGDDGPGVIRLLWGVGDGTFGPSVAYVGGSRETPTVAIDTGGSGLPDLVFPTAGEPTISILDNRGGRRLGGATLTGTGNVTSAFVSADFDEDGLPDLISGVFFPDFQNDDVFVWKGDGTGDFTPHGGFQLNQQLENLQVGRFSNSGHLDVLLQGSFGQLFILPGNGDLTFGPPVGSIDSIENSPPAVADLNNDGVDDLVAVISGVNGPDLASAITGGPFTVIPLTVPPYPEQVTAGDFDGDPYPDIAVFRGSRIEILTGNGDGTFDPGSSYAVEGIRRLVTGDVDGNGAIDVVATRPQVGTLLLLLGQGDGTFTPRQLGLGVEPTGVAVGDLDGDGIDDILTANEEDGTAAFLLSLGGGFFRGPAFIGVGAHPRVVQAIDLTGDGRTDALTSAADAVVSLINEPLGAAAAGDGSVIVDGSARFDATATGPGLLAYQWRKDGVPLANGGPIVGAQSPSLTIDPVSFADAGAYDVVVSDACGEVTSNAATLSVEFADVPLSSPFHDDILSIATAGITGGCGGGNYCPTSPVRRDQMAAFLLKSEHGSAYTPPACTGVFSDVPCPGSFTDWVEQLAAEGVTGGCGTDIYCPSQSVTRAQMAIFLLKTSEGSGYVPPAATGIFGDVPPGSFGADFIEDLYNKGITGGCSTSPLLYCPGSAVLRQQMATFLVRTFFP